MKTIAPLAAFLMTLSGCTTGSAVLIAGTLVSVETKLPGASPETMEALVTDPMEKALAALQEVDTVHSQTSQGRSYLEVRFKSRVNDDHLQQVKSAVKSVQLTLPSSASAPVVLSR